MLIQSRGAALLTFIVLALLTLVLASRLLVGPTVDAALLTGQTGALSADRTTARSVVALALGQVQADASWSEFNAPLAAGVGGGWTLQWSLPQGLALNGVAPLLTADVTLGNGPVAAIITAPDGTLAVPPNNDYISLPSGIPAAFSVQLLDSQGYPVAAAGLNLDWNVAMFSYNGSASITPDGVFTGTAGRSQSAQVAVGISVPSGWPLQSSQVIVTIQPTSGGCGGNGNGGGNRDGGGNGNGNGNGSCGGGNGGDNGGNGGGGGH